MNEVCLVSWAEILLENPMKNNVNNTIQNLKKYVLLTTIPDLIYYKSMKNKLIVLLFKNKPSYKEKQQCLRYHFKHPCLMGLIGEGLDVFIQDIFYPSFCVDKRS